MLGKSSDTTSLSTMGKAGWGGYKAHDASSDASWRSRCCLGKGRRRGTETRLREAKAASALNHPNIVHIYDIANDGGIDYIAMELVEGGTPLRLSDRAARAPGKS